ncbi:hypothetical protein HAX54_046615 [Datura stramonium]|uniref:Uncharacterized protein n=1 Tax=Datura stramonium TaxID=4076 RepID=A0ABS8WL84_DATST|nr:hypothetical protein [Datura stramonium]
MCQQKICRPHDSQRCRGVFNSRWMTSEYYARMSQEKVRVVVPNNDPLNVVVERFQVEVFEGTSHITIISGFDGSLKGVKLESSGLLVVETDGFEESLEELMAHLVGRCLEKPKQ